MAYRHERIEKNATLLLGLSLGVVAIGGIVEIVPLFYHQNVIEKVEGMRPYTPLELAGRDIYIREGCYVCHSQMIRPMRDEVERYGHYSLAAESMYDHPFQWGSKRSGPDLARVGGRYSDEWHVQHLNDPRSLVPTSIMPPYGHLVTTLLDQNNIGGHLATNAMVGVPYDETMIENAGADLLAQADPNMDSEGLVERYGDKVKIGLFDGDPNEITEMDALVAYLQMLGTLVDFTAYEPLSEDNRR
jgi:cytochrome c oxidase cbb3-type subunit 2